MGCGSCVVASNFPEIEDVVQNDATGKLFEPGNDQALADVLMQLLDDESLRNTLAKNGHAAVQSVFDWSKIGERQACRRIFSAKA